MSVWTLIYATDSSGNRTFGSLTSFRNAVRNGADVKVIYSPTTDVWWSRYCSSVNFSGSGESILISATFMEAADTTRTGTRLNFENPFALEYHIYNRTGARSMSKFDYGNHTLISQETNRIMPMKWYVKDYQLTIWDVITDLVVSALARVVAFGR